MRFTITLLVVALITSFADADPTTKPSLQMAATLITSHVKAADGRVSTRYDLTVALINSGDGPVTIITDHLDYKGNAHRLGVGLIHDIRIDGHQVVPSLPTLAPVTLQPGEAAILSLDPKALDLYQGGEFKIEYGVSNAWGERLGLWSGEVVGDVKLVAGDSESTAPARSPHDQPVP